MLAILWHTAHNVHMEDNNEQTSPESAKKSLEQSQQERANYGMELMRQMTPLADEAEQLLKSARNWGFLNILGGGTYASLTKHSKLDRVAQLMKQINVLLRQFNTLMKDELIPADFPEENDNAGKMADIFIDNLAANTFTQITIFDLQDKIAGLQKQIQFAKDNMLGLVKESDMP